MKWWKFFFGCLIGLILFLFGILIYHNHKYVCVKGHYENQLMPIGKTIMPMNVWHCDEEMLRTDFEKQNKYKKDCECQ